MRRQKPGKGDNLDLYGRIIPWYPLSAVAYSSYRDKVDHIRRIQAMAFETVEGRADFPPSHNIERDGTLTGIFLGTEEVTVADTFNGGTRESLIHRVVNEETATLVSVWGAADLDSKLAQIEAPARVQIEFSGREGFRNKQGRAGTIKKYAVARDPEWDGVMPDGYEGEPERVNPPTTDDDIPF